MKLKPQILKTIGAWVILTLFMCLLNPDKLPVVVLIVPFILLYAAFYNTWTLVSLLHRRFWTKNDSSPGLRRSLGMALSLTAVLLIVLQSLGQLTLRDVVTVLIIVATAYLYLTRSMFVVRKR